MVEEVIEDEKCINDDNEPKPSQYVLCIPHGVMLVLPEDKVHAEVFVLVAKCHVQAKFLEKKFYCRMVIIISIHAVLNWHIMIAMEKP